MRQKQGTQELVVSIGEAKEGLLTRHKARCAYARLTGQNLTKASTPRMKLLNLQGSPT